MYAYVCVFKFHLEADAFLVVVLVKNEVKKFLFFDIFIAYVFGKALGDPGGDV